MAKLCAMMVGCWQNDDTPQPAVSQRCQNGQNNLILFISPVGLEVEEGTESGLATKLLKTQL